MLFPTKVFIAYDERMLLHRPKVLTEDTESPDFMHERPSRLFTIYQTLMALEERLIRAEQPKSTGVDKIIQSILRGEGDEHVQGNQHEATLLGPVSSPHEQHYYHSLEERRYIPLEIIPASRETICRVHTERHYEFMKSTSSLSQKALDKLTKESEDLYFCRDTFGAALLAVGGCVAAVDAVTSPFRQSRRAMALVRPPAHHATDDAAMECSFLRVVSWFLLRAHDPTVSEREGLLCTTRFCYFNNIVIAAKHALHAGRASRVFILDWDVHHGNGVQELTYEDPNIFYLSIHRASHKQHGWFYPGTGKYDETGGECGVGTNVNIALKQGGMGNREYAAAFCELVLPVMEKFQPDLVMIACGADAAEGDLLGDCGLTPDMYYIMTQSVIETAGIDTPLVVISEGGYNLPVLSDCFQAVSLALLDEPFEKFVSSQETMHGTADNSNEVEQPWTMTPRWSLSRFWTPEEKVDLEGVRISHPEKGLTKRAMGAIRRAARALAFSQSRQGAFNCIQQHMDYVCSKDICQTARFRRLRMLDCDRFPAFKKPRLHVHVAPDDAESYTSE
eukprot:scaffold28_cov155-Amphora_coffeaeformis.AAC.7